MQARFQERIALVLKGGKSSLTPGADPALKVAAGNFEALPLDWLIDEKGFFRFRLHRVLVVQADPGHFVGSAFVAALWH